VCPEASASPRIRAQLGCARCVTGGLLSARSRDSRHGRLLPEGEEAFGVGRRPDGVRRHEAELEQEVRKIPIAAGPADESLPVVVQCLGSTCCWMMVAERYDLIPVIDKGVMEGAKRFAAPPLRASKNPTEPRLH